MVSLHQPPTSPNATKTTHFDSSSKKRKWDDHHDYDLVNPRAEGVFRSSKALEPTNSFFQIELQLENPLPLEWQRCLDIQSGEIHFYNTRTKKRTTRDPRRSPEPEPEPASLDNSNSNSSHMSLELELNLPYCGQSQTTNHTQNDKKSPPKYINNVGSSVNVFMDSRKDHTDNKIAKEQTVKRCPSWLAFEEVKAEEEMVAMICNKCYMLVMLCKSSPACPNCKFMHPQPEHNHKRSLSLLS